MKKIFLILLGCTIHVGWNADSSLYAPLDPIVYAASKFTYDGNWSLSLIR